MSRHMSSQVVVDTEGRVNVGFGRRGKDIATVVEDSRDYATALNVADKEVGCSHHGCTVAVKVDHSCSLDDILRHVSTSPGSCPRSVAFPVCLFPDSQSER